MRTVDIEQKTFKSFLSIIFFIFSYLVLFAGVIALVYYGSLFAMGMVMVHPSFITIMLAVGLFGALLLVFIFIIKFIFQKNKVDRSGMVQIYEKDHPKLFALIREISDEVKTHFPKKVYLTPDVNASVFYDSSFWSMFFPIKKNLQIGLGLVNSVTESEFKAILAHEFGHFSQKSMKMGSYVYNVNQIIHNMLNDNQGYANMVDSWSAISGYFAIFVVLGIKVVELIQWILLKVYHVVNITYMELSREMEFHADEIAASVAGSSPLITSLKRLELADVSYQNLLEFYSKKIKENHRPINLYQDHSYVMNDLAKSYQLEMKNNLPSVEINDLSKFNKSRIVFEDQWASHPSTDDRVKRLELLGIEKENKVDSAWNYFSKKEETQQLMTNKMFEAVQYEGEVSLLGSTKFENQFQEFNKAKTFDERYNNYYDSYPIERFDIDAAIKEKTDSENLSLESIFNDDKTDLIYTKIGLDYDIQLIEQIKNGQLLLKTFDFDGKKMKKKDASNLLTELEKERTEVLQKISQNDQDILCFFLQKDKSKRDILIEKYKKHFITSEEFNKDFELYYSVIDARNALFENHEYEEVQGIVDTVKGRDMFMRDRLISFKNEPFYEDFLSKEAKKEVEKFCAKPLKYFGNQQYQEWEIETQRVALESFGELIFEKIHLSKKELLEYQISII